MSEYKLNPPTVSSYTENMMLKVLFEHKGFSEVFRESSWRSDEIASAFGLPEELENDKNLRTVARRDAARDNLSLISAINQIKYFYTY